MNLRARSIPFVFAAGATLAGFGGCSFLPEAQSDPTKYFVLSAPAAGATAATDGPVVHLRDIDLGSYLRGRPLVVRRGENEIEFKEFARWGEPLELGIARVLRDELLARGAASAVRGVGTRREVANHDYTLNVRVLACEGLTNGGVAFRAVWDLTSTGAKPTLKARGDFRANNLRWDGKSEAALAARLSEAVAGLAAEIAAGLKR